MLDTPAAAETRGCAAQTVSDGHPRRACASRRFAKGPNIKSNVKSNVKSKSSARFERRTYSLSRSRERVRERAAQSAGLLLLIPGPFAKRREAQTGRDEATECLSEIGRAHV